MDYGFTILMFIFSGGLLLYAALLALTKNYDMLPRRATVSVSPKNKKKYTVKLARAIALVAAVPALSGLTALWSGPLAAFVFVGGLVISLWLATKIVKNEP